MTTRRITLAICFLAWLLAVHSCADRSGVPAKPVTATVDCRRAAQEIQQVILGRVDVLNICVEAQKSRPLEGDGPPVDMVLEFYVQPDGSVVEVSTLAKSGTVPEQLSYCLRHVSETLKFGPAPGGSCQVRIPIQPWWQPGEKSKGQDDGPRP